MLNLLYPISYLLALTGLVLWFYFKDNRSMSRKMSSLFLVSFFVYLISLAFTDSTLSFKLLILFRDLLILGVVSQAFNYVRKSPIIILIGAIALYGLIQFVGFSMLYSTFPQVIKSAAEPNDAFELLVETENNQLSKGYIRLIKKYGLIIQPAFQMAEPSLCKLDDYLAIGIPDKAESKTKEIIQQLKRLDATLHLEYNELIALEILEGTGDVQSKKVNNVNDPMASQQWGWDAIQGDRIHALLAKSGLKPRKRALIAIVDSGVDAQHEDIKAQFISSGVTNDVDSSGHGTHCAGIAGAVSNNGVGIASLIPNSSYVSITSVKVINAKGIGNQQKTIQGILDAADLGADVISLSLGSLSSDEHQKAYEEAIKYANAKGAIVVAAAGNNNENAKGHSPANVAGVIAVTALGSNQQKAPFSNFVTDLQYGIAAPGVKVLSTYPNMKYKELNGTSMATPMVAGLIGLLKAFRPELTTKEVYNILYDTGKKLPDGNATGRMIQAADALEKVID